MQTIGGKTFIRPFIYIFGNYYKIHPHFFHFMAFSFLFLPFLAFSFLFFPFLSCSFLFFPFLSLSALSFPFLSFPFLSFSFLSFLFFPFLSFDSLSLIFFHFLSFSLVFFPFLPFSPPPRKTHKEGHRKQTPILYYVFRRYQLRLLVFTKYIKQAKFNTQIIHPGRAGGVINNSS